LKIEEKDVTFISEIEGNWFKKSIRVIIRKFPKTGKEEGSSNGKISIVIKPSKQEIERVVVCMKIFNFVKFCTENQKIKVKKEQQKHEAPK
jgi:hypothetical protein